MRRALVFGAGVVLVVAATLVPRFVPRPLAQPEPMSRRAVVQVAPVTRSDVERVVRLTGRFESLERAAVAFRLGGRIRSVAVREGERVERGRLLATLDTTDLEREARSAAAGAGVARAQLERAEAAERLRGSEVSRRVAAARRGLEATEIRLEQAEAARRLEAGVGQADLRKAQAGVAAARSALGKARAGASPAERKLARHGLEQAERVAAAARKELAELEALFARGGISRQQVTRAREARDTAEAARAEAALRLEAVEAGPRPEEIQLLESQLEQALAGEAAAKAAGARLAVSEREVAAARTAVERARDEVAAAQAAEDELAVAGKETEAARQGYLQAREQAARTADLLREARLTAPFDGVVASVQLRPGEIAGAGMPVLTLVGAGELQVTADAPARQVTGIRRGQPCRIQSESLGSRRLTGTVASVPGVAGADGRSFPIHIRLHDPTAATPGAFVRVEVVVGRFPRALTVPVEALQEGERSASVWVVRQGRVAAVPVAVLLQEGQGAVVRGALTERDRVIVARGPLVEPGDPVETR